MESTHELVPAHDDLKKRWGKQIARLRKEFNYSKEDFAKRLGVNVVSIGRYEKGEIAPKTEVFYRMIELAKEIGYVWEFTGASLPEIYEAMLKNSRYQEDRDRALLVFLEFCIDDPDHFVRVLNKIDNHADRIHRCGNPGSPDKTGAFPAFALFTIKDVPTLHALRDEVRAMPSVTNTDGNVSTNKIMRDLWNSE